MDERFARRVPEEIVAKIMMMIATEPNRREAPVEGDVEGQFDYWFDGGAARVDTGSVAYRFSDGTTADLAAPIAALSVSIEFPNGCRVSVQQTSWGLNETD